MKTFITLLAALLFSSYLLAQPGGIKVVKQPPKINGAVKAATNATAKVKIHANSNTVHGTGNTAAYKKNQQKTEPKDEAVVKNDPPVKNSKGRKPKK